MDKYALDEKARKQVGAMLCLAFGSPRACKRCGRPIWFLTAASGSKVPYTDDAVSHFVDCPNAGEFRKGGRDEVHR